MAKYVASPTRYQSMQYRRLGNSGLKLPIVSLGLWHNFGGLLSLSKKEDKKALNYMQEMLEYAFDHGITHFDLANNYGPPYGSAERNFGILFDRAFKPYRDELIVSTKAGYDMWDGPYGDFGSRKYLMASLDQSLKRMGLDYVDIFYHHRMDPETNLEETIVTLDDIVRQGKALYVGLSNYDGPTLKKACEIFKELHTPFVINQNRYSILDQTILQNNLLNESVKQQKGIIAYSPLAQGQLSDRYLNGFSKDSRAVHDGRYLSQERVNENLDKVKALNEIALARGQSLAQMALSWVLKDEGVSSVLIGVSKVSQIEDNLKILEAKPFSKEELEAIDKIVNVSVNDKKTESTDKKSTASKATSSKRTTSSKSKKAGSTKAKSDKVS